MSPVPFRAPSKTRPLLAVLIIISAVCFLFAGRKDGMFIDEIYTYGLSNSYYAPFVTDIKGGDMRDTVMTRQELVDYLFVGEDAVRIFHLADARSNYMYNIFGIS